MDKITSVTYTIKETDNIISKEMEYKDYCKNNGEENMLYYKNTVKDNNLYETFNKLHKKGTVSNEIVGNSENKNDWFLKTFKNSEVQEEQKKGYNDLNLNLNVNILNYIDIDNIFLSNKNKNYIEDNK